jgi:hypothetical protein
MKTIFSIEIFRFDNRIGRGSVETGSKALYATLNIENYSLLLCTI